jgi:hypothetical protein
MTTQYPILWLVLFVDHLSSFGFNVAICEEENVSDKVVHQDFLNSTFGRHWTGGPKFPYEMRSSIQSLTFPSFELYQCSFNLVSITVIILFVLAIGLSFLNQW